MGGAAVESVEFISSERLSVLTPLILTTGMQDIEVINPDGQMLGIYPIHQALAVARQLELDLVEVNPKSDPPVCRIMDYGRFKYEQKKQENLAKKKRTEIELKEVKLRPKTDEHDLNEAGHNEQSSEDRDVLFAIEHG